MRHKALLAWRSRPRCSRIISSWPSRVLGVVAATLARGARAAAWASIGSDLPCRRRVLRSGWLTSMTWRPSGRAKRPGRRRRCRCLRRRWVPLARRVRPRSPGRPRRGWKQQRPGCHVPCRLLGQGRHAPIGTVDSTAMGPLARLRSGHSARPVGAYEVPSVRPPAGRRATEARRAHPPTALSTQAISSWRIRSGAAALRPRWR
jgi:hypothetical protein